MATDTAPWEDFAPEPPASSGNAAPWDDFAEERGGSTNANPVRVEVRGTSADEPTLKDTITDAARRVGALGRTAATAYAHGSRDVAAGGLKGLANLGNLAISPGAAVYDYAGGQPVGTTYRSNAEQIARDVDPLAHDKDSLLYGGASIAPEMLATGGGIASLGRNVAAQLPALGRYAAAAGDIAANAGYGGARAELTGDDAAQGAAAGGAGAAAGRMLVRAVAGLKPLLSTPARQLADAGVTLTPGQMGGRASQFAEGLAQNLPFTGAVDRVRAGQMAQYSRAEVNRALAPLGVSTREVGEDAVAHAKQLISDSYESIKPQIELPYFSRYVAVNDAVRQIRSDLPMLSGENQGALNKFIQQRIMARGGNPLDRLDGAQFKELDREIGEAIRSRLTGTPTANDREMAQALQVLQSNIRGMVRPLANADPTAVARLQATNQAFRDLLPVRDAAQKATGRLGAFNPVQFSQAVARMGHEAGDLNRAGRELLSDKRPLSRSLLRLGIGSSPVAGAAAHAAGLPGAGTAAAIGAAGAVATGIAANLIYNRPFLSFLVHGLTQSPLVAPKVSRALAGMPPERAAQMIERMMNQPGFAQAVAQLGRAYGTQQQRQPETQ